MSFDNLTNGEYEKLMASMVGKWVKITVTGPISHYFTFAESDIKIPVESGERRLSLWMAYVAYTHRLEIKIDPMEV